MNRIDYRRLLPGMDGRPLPSLYRCSIAALGNDLYSGAQRAAWARWADNMTRADEQLRQGLTVLARQTELRWVLPSSFRAAW